MSKDYHRRVMAILEEVMALPKNQHATYLNEACGQDSQLRRDVETRLKLDWEKMFAQPALTAFNPSEPLKQGTQLGSYTIVKKLGHGGMGTVYLAHHPFQKEVALKVLKRGMDTDFFLARFHQERTILAELKHPNIASMLDAGATPDGLPFFVMEYVEGLDIRTYCQKHGLSLRQRIKLFRKVCAAITTAHRQLVIHRDIKPGNILVTLDGEPKLLDFGIAKLLQEETDQTMTLTAPHLRLMTPEYASPEQWRGQANATGSDIYSLGVLLFEILTGRRPFILDPSNSKAFEQMVCEKPPPKPSESLLEIKSTAGDQTRNPTSGHTASTTKRLCRQLKGDLDTILLKALRKEPDRRYLSVEQFSEDLRRYLEGLPVSARKDTLFYRSGKFIGRHKIALAAAAILALLPITFVTGTLLEKKQTLIQKDRAMNERDKWERTTQFMVDLFERSDPLKFQGEAMTVRHLLDTAAQQLNSHLEEDFQVRADFMATIGRVYINLGQYDNAITILENALAIQEEQLDHHHHDLVPTLQALGNARLHASKFPQALEDLKQAQSISELHHQTETLTYSDTLLLRARVLTNMSQFPEAESLAKQALTMKEALLGDTHTEVAEVLESLSVIIGMQGRYQEAEPIILRDLAIREELYGKDHPKLLETLNNLAMRYKLEGNYQLAEVTQKRAISIMESSFPENHPDLAFAYSGLAANYGALGRFAEAEKLYGKSVGIAKIALKPDDPVYALYLSNWGDAFRGLRDYNRAEKLIRQGLSIRENAMGPNNPWVAHSRNYLARVLHKQKNWEEAEIQFQLATDIFEKTMGPNHTFTVNVRHNWGQLQIDQARFDEAIANIQMGIQTYRKAHDPNHPTLTYMLINLAKAYQGKKDIKKAEEACREALAIRARKADTFFLRAGEARAFHQELLKALDQQKG